MEFDLIQRIRERAGSRDDVVLGIGDDAAILAVPAGRQLVVATDTLNAGVHFPLDTGPADIGWKALAVNLSDLAAMGAEPAWCTLSLSLPEADPRWLDGFLDGFLDLAATHGVALVGGDTTRGPLSIGVTVHGFVEPGRALRRDGALVGDDVWVSGTLGDAAAALKGLQSGPPAVAMVCEGGALATGAGVDTPTLGSSAALRQRLDRPEPRIALGRKLSGVANAAIDLSDGLLADLAHLCSASGAGALVRVDDLPASSAFLELVDVEKRAALQATGGDDYELCFTACADMADRILAIAADVGVSATRIGHIVESGDGGVRAIAADGAEWQPSRAGYAHFLD